MDKESVKEKIKLLATSGKYPPGLRLTTDETGAGAVPVRLELQPVMMAIHLGMYSELRRMLIMADKICAVGGLSGRIYYPSIGMERSFGPGAVVIAHPDIPRDILALLYEKWPVSPLTQNRLEFSDVILSNHYALALYRDRYFSVLTQGIKNVIDNCPKLFEGIMNNASHNCVEMPKPLHDTECSRRRIMDYIRFLKIMMEALRPFQDDLRIFFNSVRWLINVTEDRDYIRYSDVYRDYIDLLKYMEKHSMIYEDDGHPALYGNILLFVSADLYVISTNRFREYPKDVRLLTYKWLLELGRKFHDIAGDDPLWIFENRRNDDSPLVTHFWAITPLLKYTCGYDLRYNADSLNAWRLLGEMLADLNHFGEWDKEKRIPEAVESIEILEPFENMSDSACISDEVNKTIEKISDAILMAENIELLEVALRKNIVPPFLYTRMIEKAQKDYTNTLPCLLAYRAAYRIKGGRE